MKSKTAQNLLITTILMLITAGAAASLLWFISKNSKLLSEQINVLTEQTQQESSLLRLQRLAVDTSEERERLTSHFLLRESDSISFLSDIESLAPQVGIYLETKGLKQFSDKEKLNWIEANFDISGSREDVERFVQMLELLPYVSRLTSVDMNAMAEQSWQAAITIQVQLLSYD